MAVLRFKALELVSQRKPQEITLPAQKISDYFGRNVFGTEAMRATLSSEYFKKLQKAIHQGQKVERNVADAVASAMKTWAMGKGATHYTHWFQPLTGATAEKHDSFFDLNPDGQAIENFKGSAPWYSRNRMLLLSRTAVSVIPSKPVVIPPGTQLLRLLLLRMAGTKTLCMPTIFVAYTGEALDYKAPLLKTLAIVENAARRSLPVFRSRCNQSNRYAGY